MPTVRIAVVRYIDDHFPGFVECELVDASGKVWIFVEKVPIVSNIDLDAETAYPMPGSIACTVIGEQHDMAGQHLLTIDTSRPWYIETQDGVSTFVVNADQVDLSE